MMGTHRDEGVSDDDGDELIRWQEVKQTDRKLLIIKLNPKHVFGQDWHTLADHLGFDTQMVEYFRSQQMDNAEALFSAYNSVPGASLNAVLEALQKMNRQDCVEILEDAKKVIRESRMCNQAQRDQHHLTSSQFSSFDISPSMCSNCSRANHGSHFGSVRHMCIPHSMPPQVNTHRDLQNGQSICCTSPCPRSLALQSSHVGVPVNQNLISRNMSPHQCISSPRGFQESYWAHSEFVENHHSLLQDHNQYSLSSLQPGPSKKRNNMNNLFSKGPVTALPHTLHNDGMPSPGYRRHNPDSMDVNLNTNYNSMAVTGSRQKVSRQVSEEGDLHANFGQDKRFRTNSGTCSSTNSSHQSGYQRHWSSPVSDSRSQINWSHCNGIPTHVKHISTSDDCDDDNGTEITYITSSEVGSSLNSLEQLSTVPDRLKPTQDYKTMIVDQKIESDNDSRQVKPNHASNVSRTSSGSSGSYYSEGCLEAATYPRGTRHRPQSHPEDFAVTALGKLEITKKSTSVPKDLKTNSYRLAFRSIKVFVTFSDDSSRHRKEVLSLCNFLVDNNFACCVDEGKIQNTLEFTDWYRSKFFEADFILACITPRYLCDINPSVNGVATEVHQTGKKRLHSLEIYQLMNAEYLNNQTCDSLPSPRFVPLIFEPSKLHCRLPPCLEQHQPYRWPSEYKDLVWMLSKPKERSSISRRQTNGEKK